MKLDFEEFLGPKGLKLGDKVKLLGDDTVYTLITADNCLYLYDAETYTLKDPLSLQSSFEKVEPKKKVGDLTCETADCINCPLQGITCWDYAHDTLREKLENTLKVYPVSEPMRKYFETELNKEVEEE